MNEERESAFDDDPWIIVDDTGETAEEPSATQPEPGHQPQAETQSRGGGHGWDSFASSETWNGMPVVPPGARSSERGPSSTALGAGTSSKGSGARAESTSHSQGASTDGRGSLGNGWGAARDRWDAAPGGQRAPAGGSGAPSGGTGQGASADTAHGDTAHGAWFVDRADHPDNTDDPKVGVPARRSLAGRLPQFGPPAFGPGSTALTVTFLVTILGVLLVISSIIWHPVPPTGH